MKDFLSDKIKIWVIYAFYGIFILSCLNTCNSCSRNKENKEMIVQIISLNKQVDSLNKIVTNLPKVIDNSCKDNLAKSTYFSIRTFSNYPNADFFKVEEEQSKFLKK